jgi:hypothetical protein
MEEQQLLQLMKGKYSEQEIAFRPQLVQVSGR